jgi:ketosteroid isomerase-like protein
MMMNDRTADIQAIKTAEMDRCEALVAVDFARLDRLFSDDLVHVHSNAMVHGKAQLFAHIDKQRHFRRIERGDLTIRVHGDTAVMTGSMRSEVQVDGKDGVMDGFVTQVLRREDSGWRFISFQLTLKKAG